MSARKGNKYAEGNDGGRPTKYKKEFAEQAYKLCLLGATDKELAGFFNVTEQTINNWKSTHKEFFESLHAGKKIADAEVAKSFYDSAVGFEYETEEAFQFQGVVTKVTIKKTVPGDHRAALNWLKNRQPDKWRDKQDVNHSSEDGSFKVTVNID